MIGVPPPPLFTDSRRVFGPTPWLDGPGAVLDVPLPHGHDAAFLEAWQARVEAMRGALGWSEAAPGPLTATRHASGTILGVRAPVHLLLSATHLAEWAARTAADAVGAPFDPASLDEEALPLGEDAARVELSRRIETEAAEPPDPHRIEPRESVLVALVTGSNGKTTTTRLLAAILEDHGHTVGFTSTDGVKVGGVFVERGDWSGPLGAARVLGAPEVTAAVLETARGGLLRRGLVVPRADVALITNISEDHFGEYGVDSEEALARVKGLVARALGPGGVLILNGDDPHLSPAGPDDPDPPPCVRLSHEGDRAKDESPAGGNRGGTRSGGDRAPPPIRVLRFSLARPWPAWLPPAEALPLTAGGAARYNAANALAAALAARALGVPEVGIARTLLRFGARPEDNPGRLVREEVGGITLLFDYAHNPAGLTALMEVAAAAREGARPPATHAGPGSGLPPGSPAPPPPSPGAPPSGRLLLLLGQAGDREDEAIRALARAAWAARPDRILLRELAGYDRGRQSGEVPGILAGELVALGAGPHQVHTCLDEHAAVEEALRWARPGDLLVLPIHGLASRERVLARVAALRAAGWRAGEPLPPGGPTGD